MKEGEGGKEGQVRRGGKEGEKYIILFKKKIQSNVVTLNRFTWGISYLVSLPGLMKIALD